ncbi:MAG: hypothetical protein KBT88_05550 [Gammaproteobacteria bacterium]|nr:hypothetical protein [Gammaproteobacteria bacterium]MBQ0839233.1 hypothetical protein [Gammaproteobacteria bacterium]
MKNSAFKFYVLLVCFTALMCGTVTLGLGLYNLVSVINPDLTINNAVYKSHKNTASFRQFTQMSEGRYPQALFVGSPAGMPMPFVGPHGLPSAGAGDPVKIKKLSNEQVEALRLKSLNSALDDHQRAALQNLIRQGIVFCIALVLFSVHWRMARRYNINNALSLQ